MSVLNQFYHLTNEMIQLLENSQGERDDKITQVEMVLNQREALINEIVPPYTTEEVEVGHKLIQLNEKLSQLLHAEKISIHKDIKDLQTKKESNKKYINPYKSLSTDGMFYDKRK